MRDWSDNRRPASADDLRIRSAYAVQNQFNQNSGSIVLPQPQGPHGLKRCDWPAMPNPPVNKRFLSTGETGEFASGNVGFGRNPWGSAATRGVELAPPRCLSSNRRERAAGKNLRNVADTDEGDARRCCQQKQPLGVGAEK